MKTRETAEFGTPDRNIGPEKERALIRAARQFIREAGVGWEHVRFDVVSVVMGKPPLIEHHPDVFYPERGTRS